MLDAAEVFPVHRGGGITEEVQLVTLGRLKLDHLRGHDLKFRNKNEHAARRLDPGAGHSHLGRLGQVKHIIDISPVALLLGQANRDKAFFVRTDEKFHRLRENDTCARIIAALN